MSELATAWRQGAYLFKGLQESLEIKFRGNALYRGQGLTSIALLNTNVNVFLCFTTYFRIKILDGI